MKTNGKSQKMVPGRESPSPQCYECAHCGAPSKEFAEKCRRGSCFGCSFTGNDYETWHMNVPEESPCQGLGWKPKSRPSFAARLASAVRKLVAKAR